MTHAEHRPTATTIITRAEGVAKTQGLFEAQVYVVRELKEIGIAWDALPERTREHVLRHLDLAARGAPALNAEGVAS